MGPMMNIDKTIYTKMCIRDRGISSSVLEDYASQLGEIAGLGCELAIVIGGGNIFRGLSGTKAGVDRVKGDQMGMLATVINSLALESAIRNTCLLYTSRCV